MAADAYNNLWTNLDLLKSEAFRSLSRGAMLLLHDVYAKKRVKGKGNRRQMLNNGEITFTYAEAEKMGYPRASFMRYRDELIAHGFLKITETGAGLYKSSNLYALSNEWRRYGRPDFSPQKRESRARRYPGFTEGHPRYGVNGRAADATPPRCTDGSL